ncbi:metalloregulator ArsR/SmtB family transcription factor [Shewanella gelidii]|uniref:metalloregulator ArsR/SmtB family transcription factor n=1 Tax=Shewanella gelidii TaxID=1642821 RepID=UPI001667808E|nr:metalloregulator ArsR/SmtB family transcription factor [Shewanella gelidii]MCL1097843.1 metalloregulator ArsR/SmtB family transcription factor [Shewanella gelidii]
MNALSFYKCLADETRLKCLLLMLNEGELCVCEFVSALALPQPKISRHLALLRQQELIQDRRQGQWVFYRVNPQLATWATNVLKNTLAANPEFIRENLAKLNEMGQRPERLSACCP